MFRCNESYVHSRECYLSISTVTYTLSQCNGTCNLYLQKPLDCRTFLPLTITSHWENMIDYCYRQISQSTFWDNWDVIHQYQHTQPHMSILILMQHIWALLGSKIVVHEKLNNRKTFASHNTEAWYIGPSTDLDRCFKCFMPETCQKRDTDTVEFFLKKYYSSESPQTIIYAKLSRT